MKNRLVDLNDHLFAQLERLTDESLSDAAIAAEIQRAQAIVKVAGTIVANAQLQLEACELVAQYGDRVTKNLPMIAASPPASSPPALSLEARA